MQALYARVLSRNDSADFYYALTNHIVLVSATTTDVDLIDQPR